MLSDAIIDVSEEDGTVLASPRKLRRNFYKIKPNNSLIRIQGLNTVQRDKALNKAYERLEFDLNNFYANLDDFGGI